MIAASKPRQYNEAPAWRDKTDDVCSPWRNPPHGRYRAELREFGAQEELARRIRLSSSKQHPSHGKA